jgi:glycosyltransferase involved in cell wall biosynthesis/tetratricopeptide (TPR) repeat protein
MKIVHLSSMSTGGAATAAFRLHKGIQAAGVNSKMLVLHKTACDDSVIPLFNCNIGPLVLQKKFQRWNAIAREYPARPKGLELFSDTHTEVSLNGLAQIADADIVHLHWVAGILNLSNLPTVFAKKKIVWTLHDMNPFTGGCHYSGDCLKYQQQCGACPQLGSSDSGDLSYRTWKAKADGYAAISPTIVSPSRWLASCAKNSQLMDGYSVRVIPYGLPLETFKPRKSPAVRQRWNIPDSERIVLFGAQVSDHPRKGLHYLHDALKRLVLEKKNQRGVVLLVFGDTSAMKTEELPFRVISAGTINNLEWLSEIYAAADVFVIPSLEDNLPNTALEALACGTPVVGFRTGGIVDIVEHLHTGFLADKADPKQLAEGIQWIMESIDNGTSFAERCRGVAEIRYASRIQADAYVQLYEEITGRKSHPHRSHSCAPLCTHESFLGETPLPYPKITTRLMSIPSRHVDLCLTEHPLKTGGQGCSITVVLPTKDRAQGLAKVLASLPASMQDLSYEVIVYAGRPDPEVVRVIQEYGISKVFFDKDVFRLPESFSWSRLMNHGFAQAAGEWVMYGSDDIVFYPGCFKQALAVYHRASDPSTGGITFLHCNTADTDGNFFKDFGYDTLNGDKVYINFGLIRRDAFVQTSGFDETFEFFWADVDICAQLWMHGFKIVPSYASLVDHNNGYKFNQKERRDALFRADTAQFLKKWHGASLFNGKSPLEKVRFCLIPDDSRKINMKLSRSCAPTKVGEKTYSRTVPLNIAIDGVIFQLQHRHPLGIARVWSNLLPALIERYMPEVRFTLIQRRGFPWPGHLAGQRHEIDAYQWNDEAVLEKDDAMLGATCHALGADLFISTYFTRAAGCTNLVMVHDLIPELTGACFNEPEWRSKRRAIETGDLFATVSQSTLNDLHRFYPQAAKRPCAVVGNGTDAVFRSPGADRIRAFREKYTLFDPYLLVVGNRRGYKNAASLFDAIEQRSWKEDLRVVCVGGESRLTSQEQRLANSQHLRFLPYIPDLELTAAYGGAQALICTSTHEGFGLPVVEAMACGCPAIVSEACALREVGADAVITLQEMNAASIESAIARLNIPEIRAELIQKGFTRAAQFNWDTAAHRLNELIDAHQKKTPLCVSAIVSAYKSEKFMRGCLEDLLAQSMTDRLEIIVIDSASPENEAQIVHEFQKNYDNIKYIRTAERESVYAAWNRGIKFARGRYITNANTDDRHRRNAFEQMAAVLEAEPDVALVYADVIKTATANETFAHCTPTGMLSWCDWDRRVLLEKGCFIGPQPMWRRQVHDTFGYFDESMTVTGDYEFWLRISQIHKFKHIARPLGLYLERGDSVEHANAECKRQEERTIKARYRRAAQRGEMIGIKSRTDLREQHKAPSENKDGPGAQEYQSKDAALNAAPTKGDRIMKLADQVYAVIRTLPENQREIARWMLGKLLIDFPDHAAAQHECAILAHDEGDTAAARVHFQRAAELAPGNADMQKSLADFLHVVQKDPDTAVAQYRKVLTLRPRDLETCLIIAHLNVSRRCFDEAREDYRKVLALDPNHGEARTCLGKLDALKARRISPAELHAKARLACEEGDKPSAIRFLSQLITQNHGDAVAHNDLGVLYFETGRKDLAQFHYETAAELAPENALFQKNLGDFYYVEQGQIEKALRKYVQALTLNPEDVETLLITGQLCLSIDRPEDARVFLNRVLEIEPWNDQAGTLLDQLSQTGGTPIRGGAEDLYSRSQSLSASGDSAGAADCLRRLIAEYPDHAAAYNDLGVMHYELGEKNKALQYYEQAVRLNDKSPTFLKNLADFYYVEQGRAQDALNIYVQLMESNHEDVDCLIAAGSICAGLDKESDARIFFERVLQIDPWHTQAGDALRQMDLNAAAVDRAAAVFEFPRSAAAGHIV